MNAGPWSTLAEFEAWWKANVVAFNRLAVSDPEEWERVAREVETFRAKEHALYIAEMIKETGK